MQPIIAALLAFMTTAVLSKYFQNSASPFHILDIPNERSLHDRPIPKSGGIAVFVGIGLSWVASGIWNANSPTWWAIIPSAFLIVIVSWLDDTYKVHPSLRLIAHFIAAVTLLASGLALPSLELPGGIWYWPSWLGGAILILYVVWMINSYNFLDGMDGFAGGMAVFGFGSLAVLGGLAGNAAYLSANISIAAASAGFLIFNFPPAKIFLGDMGSTLLGLLAAANSLWGVKEGIFPLWVAVLVFSPFIVDATLTLGRRLLRGERIWRAHKEHYYQRLVLLGWGHRRTVLWGYLLMAISGSCGLLATKQAPPVQWGLIGLISVVYGGLLIFIPWLEARKHS